ncbi:MAG: hypothetical protein AAF599_15580, partial [Bacteroidota bacterium]
CMDFLTLEKCSKAIRSVIYAYAKLYKKTLWEKCSEVRLKKNSVFCEIKNRIQKEANLDAKTDTRDRAKSIRN